MKIEATLKFISPCFCAGADPLVAEIRAPSLRGQLRWWFRCLGGSKEEETKLFGSMSGSGNASLLQVRVANLIRTGETYNPPHAKLEDPGSYLHFFLDQAPKDRESRLWITPPNRKTSRKGIPRPESCIPAGSSFTVSLAQLRHTDSGLKEKLDLAIQGWLRFGSVGYRQTRGFGAWSWHDHPLKLKELKDLAEQLRTASGKCFDFWFAPNSAPNASLLLNQIESKLKGMRKPASETIPPFPASSRTALGYSLGKDERQTSAVRFRPVEFQTAKGDLQFGLVIFQAPDRVLARGVPEPRRLVPGLVPK